MEAHEAGKGGEKTYGTAPGRRHFLIRRLHSLMGLMFGGFITTHLLVNATGLWPRMYQENVDHIHSMEPLLPLIEILTIFLPLLIHALYGIYITKAGVKFNTTKYMYGGNVRYTLQRWAGVVLLLFIAFHIATLHKWGLAGVHQIVETIHPTPMQPALDSKGNPQLDLIQQFSSWCQNNGGLFEPHNQAFQSTVSGIHYLWDSDSDKAWCIGNIAFMAFYLLGIWSATFHFANGLWTSAIAWGLTTTANSQRRWGHACLGFGIMLTIAGTMAWAAFTIAPAAQGDLGRWNDSTHTLSDDSAVHEQDQGVVVKTQEMLKGAETKP